MITSCWDADPDARPTFEEIMETLKNLMNGSNISGPIANNSESEEKERERERNNNNLYFAAEAPTGVVYFVQTGIEKSGELWDTIPMQMLDASCMNFILLYF